MVAQSNAERKEATEVHTKCHSVVHVVISFDLPNFMGI